MWSHLSFTSRPMSGLQSTRHQTRTKLQPHDMLGNSIEIEVPPHPMWLRVTTLMPLSTQQGGTGGSAAPHPTPHTHILRKKWRKEESEVEEA
jgi:hypothetical protein